ncbi:MAG: N-acetyl-gamma-glutamyl-phosphate reductase [Ruminococcaceae bacterium]|nr:N-acetyl-gamma-glutamyl-phosphate reductase [Oscillospiraceae bacterium]
MTKIFIDGSAGTTGLRIRERLENRPGLDILTLPEELRKDPEARRVALNSADIAFLCLPDAAAREAVALVDNPDTVIIDTSTAHRTADGWTYGFPELVGKDAIKNAKRIANPGCHASGFVALVAPLVKAGLIAKDAKLTCFSLTGYSGGGKPMIADYQSENRDPLLDAPRQYGLGQTHKHLPEMAKVCGLVNDPIFCPIVGDFYSGMEVTVPLFGCDVKGTIEDIKSVYYHTYTGRLVTFNHQADEGGFLSAAALSGSDGMQLTATGNADRILLTARFDNLGKGASGAAIQNMNILLGVDETTGLSI